MDQVSHLIRDAVSGMVDVARTLSKAVQCTADIEPKVKGPESLKDCPFCGGKPSVYSETTMAVTTQAEKRLYPYCTAEETPKGYEAYIRCDDCKATIDRGLFVAKKYIDESLEGRVIRYEIERELAVNNIIKTWNRRVKCS